MTAGDRFALEIPAVADHVGTARAFASALARQLGVSDEVVEDVKLAVSEACTDAVLGGSGAGTVRLLVLADPDVVTMEIDAPGAFRDPGGDGADRPLGGAARLELIRSLFPGADLSQGAGGDRRLRFIVPLR